MISAMSLPVALQLALSVCFLSLSGGCRSFKSGGQPPPAIRATGMATTAAETAQVANSWALPDVDPCTLVTRAEAEAVMGLLKKEPNPGGTAADGTSCAYVGTNSLVVTIGVISTNTFELRKFDSGNTTIAGIGDEAYMTKPNAFGDVYLYARKGEAAVMVNVTVGAEDEMRDIRQQIAGALAQRALDRLLERMDDGG